MYVTRVNLENIRAIKRLELTFPSPAGWHVLIGDNGSGKSTIVRCLGLALIGPEEAPGLRLNYKEWLQPHVDTGVIRLDISPHDIDGITSIQANKTTSEVLGIIFRSDNASFLFGAQADGLFGLRMKDQEAIASTLWSSKKGCFSAGFGPFRRFTGGSKSWEDFPSGLRRASSHLSLFGEDVALTEALKWLQQLHYEQLEERPEAREMLDCLRYLINSSDLLPHGALFGEVSSAGVSFIDGNGIPVDVTQLSDGFRSILSLTFELIRQLVRCYGQNLVLENLKNYQPIINLPGVVLIDEIDAHLHPTWQTRIGTWFTKVFPRIQFIVTSHSPLVCRAAVNGSVWRLAAPGSNRESAEVTGIEKDRLVYGNILDAYGTELFGTGIERGEPGVAFMEELAELNMKALRSGLNKEEEQRHAYLQSMFPSGGEAQ
ncbi:MAG: AAA family ATPase [Flavobacteriales bacterium]|nr:AAA family ATPase [Flavobacteriales bacterium]